MIKELRKLEEKGLITLRPHNELPLFIANYTPDVQYDRLWDEHPLLTQCRGLIVDEDGEVIARPFEKFFNYEEHMDVDSLPDIPNEPFDVYEKMDGSLGIVFYYKGKWRVATRGSFHSDQAEKAQEMLNHYGTKYLPHGYTYLVEIIYPENRIVVNYGSDEKLVLLAVIKTSTGEEKDVYDFQFTFHEIVKRYSGINDIETLTKMDDENREGFVLHFKSGLRIKVKLEEYVRLHRLLTGLTKRTIWELLKDGEDIEKIYETAPDEVYDWVEETVSFLERSFYGVEGMSEMVFEKIKEEISDEDGNFTRKDFALFVKDTPLTDVTLFVGEPYSFKVDITSIMFRLLDECSIDDLIWKSIKPEHEPIEATV